MKNHLLLLSLLVAACGQTASVADSTDVASALDTAVDTANDTDTVGSGVTLPAACGVAAPQRCSPPDGGGCDANTTCDLAADGTWQCVPGGSATVGQTCDGLQGPFCAAGLTCVGTTTGAATCARLCCDTSACAGTPCWPLHAVGDSAGNVGVCLAAEPTTVMLGTQPAHVEGRGHIHAWKGWRDALALQMAWYVAPCPEVGGYPLLASATHWGADCNPDPGDEVIAAMQDATAILSDLAWDTYNQHADPKLLTQTRRYADYLLEQAVTPDSGLWPKVFRSTGTAMTFPMPPNCGLRSDQPYEVEPDKIAMAGYALLKLADATGEKKYADAALHQATVLAANIVPGTAEASPWPFRVDWRDGTTTEPISGNMVYMLRLFDALLAKGHTELQKPRDQLWAWMRDVQIPNAATGGTLWAEFFEDWIFQNNRTAWAPLATASYLLEAREAIDPDWRQHADLLLAFVEVSFVDIKNGWPVCIEQDFDRKPFGGILSTYAAAEARWAAVTGDPVRRSRAYMATALLIQSINSNGCPADRALSGGCGGWQEDAHTDRVHNLVTVLQLFPAWAK